MMKIKYSITLENQDGNCQGFFVCVISPGRLESLATGRAGGLVFQLEKLKGAAKRAPDS